jgi:hypothetical protein
MNQYELNMHMYTYVLYIHSVHLMYSVQCAYCVHVHVGLHVLYTNAVHLYSLPDHLTTVQCMYVHMYSTCTVYIHV